MKTTVQELMEELSKCNPDAQVWIRYPFDDNDWQESGTLQADEFFIEQDDGFIEITII